MTLNLNDDFHDELVPVGAPDLPERFFDRFVFNLHPTDMTTPSVLLGYGVYPGRDTVDGFAILVDGDEQRNVRWSTEFSATTGDGAGPFRFQVVEPMNRWRLSLGANPTGLELDVVWQARTSPWIGRVEVQNASSAVTSFDHLVQSGRFEGVMRVDGVEHVVDGWYGQRDRSRGVRTMAGGQGLHVWFQAQFPDRSVGFLLVESRTGERILLEGAVMHTDGQLDDLVDVVHDLQFEDIDLRSGRVRVRTAGGAEYRIDADASARGGFMAGGGYGGHHGVPKGHDTMEFETYRLDGTVSQLTLDSSLTDRLASFMWDGTAGSGVLSSRSPEAGATHTCRRGKEIRNDIADEDHSRSVL